MILYLGKIIEARKTGSRCFPLASKVISVSYLNRITFDPEQCGGRPCIRGYRLRVKDVLDMLGAGMTEPEILKDYPFLEPEDIRACLQFAAAQVDHAILQAV
jgi:uncharacterized protein (DUF433 family)